MRGVDVLPIGVECKRYLLAQVVADLLDVLRIDVLPHGFGNFVFGRQGEHQFFEGGIKLRVLEHGTQGLQRGGIEYGWLGGGLFCALLYGLLCAAARCLHGGYGLLQHQALCGFPAVKRVGIVRQQVQQGCLVLLCPMQLHGCRELAQERWRGCCIDLLENKLLLGLREHQHTLQRCLACTAIACTAIVCRALHIAVFQMQRQCLPIGSQ